MRIKVLILLSLIILSQVIQAAVPKKNLMRKPAPVLLGAGSIKGGKAGIGFSLLNVSTKISKSQRAQRIQFDMGNGTMHPLKGPVAYFNIQNDPKNRKITIDFSQTMNSRFEQNTLAKIFSKSPFIEKSELIFEPESQTMSVILTTKKIAAIRAKPMMGTPKATARLVLDIFDPSLVKKVR